MLSKFVEMPASPTQGATKRPKYPPLLDVLRHEAVGLVRGPLIATMFLCFVFRPHILPGLVAWFATVDLTFLPQFAVDYAGSPTHTTVRDVALVAAMLFAIHEGLYFGMNTVLYMCDQMGWLQQYRLPRTKRMLPSGKLVITCLVEGIVNQFLIQPATLYLLLLNVTNFEPIYPKDGNNLEGSDPKLAVLPYQNMPFQETFFYLFGAMMLNHAAFYLVHRAVHLPGLYIPIHKKHHKFVGTIGWAAEFAHPLEQIFANQLPTVAFVLIMYTKEGGQEVAWTWLFWRLWETYEHHSGYDFSRTLPGRVGLLHGAQARFHDWHHTDNRGCFGYFCTDWLFGTMDSYVALVMTHPVTGKISHAENYSVLHEQMKKK